MSNRSYLSRLSPASSHAPGEPPEQGRKLAVFIGLSIVLHLCFFLASLFFQHVQFSKPQPRVVRVDLVSFSAAPSQAAAPAAPAPESVEPQPAPADAVSVAPAAPEPTPDPQPVVHIKKDGKLKAKPKKLKKPLDAKKKSKPKPKAPRKKLKEKSKVDPDKALAKARQDLEKRVEAENQKQLDQALARLKDKVSSQKTPGTGTGVGNGNAGGGPGRPGGPLELYQTIIQSAIEQNWVFNETLGPKNPGLETRMLIKILKSGEIRDIVYETRSGNQYLDESAKKAIQRANPLPRLPQGMTSYELVIIFTPKGLK